MAHVLVIDTCGSTGYVAVADTTSSAALAERVLGERATQEELLPAVHSVLAEAGIPLQDLRALAVTRGPGSFTGVRIGLATAKGLCEAGNIPLLTLSRLAVLAESLPSADGERWAWLQAGRGDVYAGRFAGEMLAKESLLSAEAARLAVGGLPVAICEGALRAVAPDVVLVDARAFAGSLLRLAVQGVARAVWDDVALADATYIRVPDAELALRARQG